MDWKYFTAEGMRDKLPAECYIRRVNEDKLRRLFRLWGYDEVETPELEFADVYLYDRFVRQEALYKLSDPQGRLLALRYDNTVPLARMAATSGRNLELPMRLAYTGSMFRLNDAAEGQSHQFEQAGVELMGPVSSAADAEVLALAIESLLCLGAEDFQIVLNQTAFFKALLDDYALDDETRELLPALIDGKEFVRLDQLMEGRRIDGKLVKIVETIMETGGSYEVLEAMEELVQDGEAARALAELREILDYLEAWDLSSYVSIDLGLLKNLSYYTGMIFRGYAPGAGAPVLSGGRYDNLCAAFGRDLPARGFSLDLELLHEALYKAGAEPEDLQERTVLRYKKEDRKAAFKKAKSLRDLGIRVCLDEIGEEDGRTA